MNNVWVYDFDGTIQCDENSKEFQLDAMGEKLKKIIGVENVITQKKSSIPMIQLCGMPTGTINTYEITPSGWTILSTGFVGFQGFKKLDPEELQGGDVNIGKLFDTLTKSRPRLIQELVGHPVRIYTAGDMLTLDLRPNRCNIETSERNGGAIVKVWFG